MKLKKTTGQIFSEYAITLVIVLSAVTAMVVFLQRAIQAKVRDAREHMVVSVASARKDIKVYRGYEPYYTVANGQIAYNATVVDTLRPGGATGAYRQELDDTIDTKSSYYQLPAAEALNDPLYGGD